MSEGRPSFWTTLPGVLTGLAALVTALVAAGALFLGQDRDGSDEAVADSGTAAADRAGDGDPDPAPASSGESSSGPDQAARPTAARRTARRSGCWPGTTSTSTPGSRATAGSPGRTWCGTAW
ncbi:hypothetical protein [Modestobacter sp. VKM Ac-2985]|uniref:hypothetical protein n=1 Tax=Modestobacter sp. VKM Ac-2985 TaxID=3004139 RepID=UPI0022ABBE30|nr:hypothetical protein [Modestobacter sp. VKM Ac-2985]MCZ2839177.1 hypothetical protein [Modestobacter sp. VKM Ac-2985]